MANTPSNKKIYKVSFKGVIFPGFDKEQVIENVHNITRIPKHTITRKFFSGKVVVIRRADSQEYASQLQKKFAQAGIETYITEYSESIPKESATSLAEEDALELSIENTTDISIGESHELDDDAQDKAKAKPGFSLIASLILIVAIAVATSFYFFNNSTLNNSALNDNSEPTALETNTAKQRDSSAITEKPKQAINTININKPVAFLQVSNIQRLIKITSTQEIKHLERFLNTFNLLNGNQDAISSLLADLYQPAKDIKHPNFQDNNPIPLSLKLDSTTPLYIYQTEEHAGVFIGNQTTDATILVKEIRQQIKHLQKPVRINNQCKQPPPKLSVSMLAGYIFIANFEPPKTLSQLTNKQLKQQLTTLDSLFVHPENNHNTSFNFYYRYPNKKHKGFIRLTSDNEQFWLSMDRISQNSTAALLEELQIDTQQGNKWQTNKYPNLYALTLILLGKNHIQDNLAKTISHKNFKAEHIINIEKTSLIGKTAEYQRNLDLEFIPQWTTGSFAAAINQFQFDENLTIELIAKGQNVRNFMEYSHSVTLSIPEILNNNNENILQFDCSKKRSISSAHYPKSYFFDREGEQEAYINDDFISFQNITAKQIISVKPGYSVHDIKLITVGIHLNLPEKIFQKTLFPKPSARLVLFNDFSILIKHKIKTNELRYEILGNAQHFITLRAYNESGDILETLSFDKQSELDNTLTHYQQRFSDKIASIKVFYSKEMNSRFYIFSIKPNISSDKKSTAPLPIEEVSLVSYNPGNLSAKALGFKALDRAIQEDNPAWLGEKWQGEKTNWSNDFPFYINVFMQEANPKQSQPNTRDEDRDAVFSIKTSLTPFISQNITAIKLSLFERNKNQLNQFISFHRQAIPMSDNSEQETEFYLSINKAFKLTKDQPDNEHPKHLHGEITLYLPKTFESHLKPYTSLGQTIDLGDIRIKSIRLDDQQITFEISEDLKKLVQLKLYNKEDELISEVFEFKQIEDNKAHLSLSYRGSIDKIKIVLTQKLAEKKYPFSFSD